MSSRNQTVYEEVPCEEFPCEEFPKKMYNWTAEPESDAAVKSKPASLEGTSKVLVTADRNDDPDNKEKDEIRRKIKEQQKRSRKYERMTAENMAKIDQLKKKYREDPVELQKIDKTEEKLRERFKEIAKERDRELDKPRFGSLTVYLPEKTFYVQDVSAIKNDL